MIGKLEKSWVVPIVNDGAIASPQFGDGRLIPVLVVDCQNHPEVLNLIYLHQHNPPGDATVKWGVSRFRKNRSFLVVEFSYPTEVTFALEFNLDKSAVVADAIVQARAVYLQPKESGARVLEGLENPKILIEVGAGSKLSNWDSMLLKNIRKRLKREGLSSSEAKLAAEAHLERMREIWTKRMDNA